MLFKDIDISKMSSVLMLSKNCIIELQNHRNVVWKGPLKALSPPPGLKQDYCQYQNRSAMALSNQVLKTCKHGDSITSPGNLSQYCIDFLVIFFPSSIQFELPKPQLVVVANFYITCHFLVRLSSIISVIVSRSDRQVINSPLTLFSVKLNQHNSFHVSL